MTEDKCSSCIYARFNLDSKLECDPPMGECTLEQPEDIDTDLVDQPDNQSIIPD